MTDAERVEMLYHFLTTAMEEDCTGTALSPEMELAERWLASFKSECPEAPDDLREVEEEWSKDAPPLPPKTPEEIQASYWEWYRSVAPEGTRLIVNGEGEDHVEVVCGGSVDYSALRCCLEPGHEGDCYSAEKRVDFKPVRGEG